MENMSSMVENPKQTLIESVRTSSKESLAPDISNIEVKDDYASLILERSFGVESKPRQKKIERVRVPNRGINALVNEFFEVVSKAKSLIQEMTTCGMLGTNTTGLKKKKKVKRK